MVGFGIATSADIGPNHGVYVVEETKGSVSQWRVCVSTNPCFCSCSVWQNKAKVLNILQKASLAELKERGAVRGDGSVLLDSGIVYFSARATQDFLRLAKVLPLSSCTSAGLDLGPAPLRFELYTDVLLCMNPAMSKEQFMATPLPDRKSDPQAVAKARELLWATFHPHPFTVIRWVSAVFEPGPDP